MNLKNYLHMTVTPLSEYTPSVKRGGRPVIKREPIPRQLNNEEKRKRGIEACRAALGEGWWTATEIKERTGNERIGDSLVRWFRKGLIERRKSLHTDRSNFEWRML